MTQYVYTYNQFPNEKCNAGRLNYEILESAITIQLVSIEVKAVVYIYFKTDLSEAEVTILDNIIANHSGEALTDDKLQIVRAENLTEHLKYVEENDIKTLYTSQSLVIDISAGEADHTADFTWPFDITLMTGTLGVSEEMVGDYFSAMVAPNTLIGATTADWDCNPDTSIYVTSTVAQNIKVGYYLGEYTTNTDIGRVTHVDANNNIIRVDSTYDSSTMAAGTYLSMTPKIVQNLYLHSQNPIEIGKQMPTGQRIPANTIVRIEYHNTNEIAKKFSFFVEYLY